MMSKAVYRARVLWFNNLNEQRFRIFNATHCSISVLASDLDSVSLNRTHNSFRRIVSMTSVQLGQVISSGLSILLSGRFDIMTFPFKAC
jgi:hypothetical protein